MREQDKLDSQRLDKWLSIARLFKTRKLATQACENRHVKVNEVTSKASKTIKVGDEITIRLRGKYRSFQILGIIKRNVSAQYARELYEETTSLDEDPEQQELIRLTLKSQKQHKPQYKGRPTKKERRKLTQWADSIS